ncbi:patatin-like phospholipase family protein [Flavobacterium algicola]|uniref:patatin-like phospholipase family protein n=1 Tax=Flavobacterium algicola TaxID=556529 RepID=UPI001EFC56E6|nr:patatin-like phospholipase family protein [Flavobacterium algicola]MCG9792235.1 patatin-like phospholipase family protein [Flavobacterium algicola]
MRALIISGGGSKGAFAGGIAEYLINDCCNQYELYVGCSTGCLLLPHLALGKIDKIKNIYTSVTQEDIFSISPFIITKNDEGYETKINHFNSVLSFIKGSPTFGESLNLKKLIKKNITVDEYDRLQEENKQVIVTVSNLTLNQVEYHNSKDCTREDFCEWAWASCNYVPFMSLVNKNGHQYADGGFGNFVPISCAIENGATEIDVIILENEDQSLHLPEITNAFSLLFRTFEYMKNTNNSKDIIIGKLIGMNKNVKINFYFTPDHLTDNPLIFDAAEMTQWWKDGYEYAKSRQPDSFCHVSKPEEKELKVDKNFIED